MHLTTVHLYSLTQATAPRVSVAVRTAKADGWIDFMPPGWFG